MKPGSFKIGMVLVFSLLLSACGGGNSSDEENDVSDPIQVTPEVLATVPITLDSSFDQIIMPEGVVINNSGNILQVQDNTAYLIWSSLYQVAAQLFVENGETRSNLTINTFPEALDVQSIMVEDTSVGRWYSFTLNPSNDGELDIVDRSTIPTLGLAFYHRGIIIGAGDRVESGRKVHGYFYHERGIDMTISVIPDNYSFASEYKTGEELGKQSTFKIPAFPSDMRIIAEGSGSFFIRDNNDSSYPFYNTTHIVPSGVELEVLTFNDADLNFTITLVPARYFLDTQENSNSEHSIFLPKGTYEVRISPESDTQVELIHNGISHVDVRDCSVRLDWEKCLVVESDSAEHNIKVRALDGTNILYRMTVLKVEIE